MTIVARNEVRKYLDSLKSGKSRDYSPSAKRKRAKKVFRFKTVGKAFHRKAGRRSGKSGLPSTKYRVGRFQ